MTLVRKIVIEFGDPALEDLKHLQEVEELNVSTITNRAVQMYWVLKQAQMNSTPIIIGNERIRFE